MNDLLLNYVKFNLWANGRIVGKLGEVPPELWTTAQKSSFKSIRDTLLHICGAEMIWYHRLNGTSMTSWPGDGFTGTNDDAAQMLLRASQELVDYVSRLSVDDFTTVRDFKTIAGAAYQASVNDMLLHCINHSTFHRGQIVTMLRNRDVDGLPSTDYIAYIRMQGDV